MRQLVSLSVALQAAKHTGKKQCLKRYRREKLFALIKTIEAIINKTRKFVESKKCGDQKLMPRPASRHIDSIAACSPALRSAFLHTIKRPEVHILPLQQLQSIINRCIFDAGLHLIVAAFFAGHTRNRHYSSGWKSFSARTISIDNMMLKNIK